MTDSSTTLADLKALLLRGSRERAWERFHHPKDLGLALACETGELLEHFRFRTDDEIAAALADPSHLREVAHEMADRLWALLRLADVCGVDLSATLEEKVVLAAIKYPIDRSYGRPDKYTAYETGPGTTDESSRPLPVSRHAPRGGRAPWEIADREPAPPHDSRGWTLDAPPGCSLTTQYEPPGNRLRPSASVPEGVENWLRFRW